MKSQKQKKCLQCGKEFDRSKLSHKGYCYDCGKERMLATYDAMWSIKGQGA